MKTFKNKVAVVTGAGSGIGRHLAMQLSQAGAELALSDINAAGLAETLSMLAGQTRVKTYLVDVSKKEHMFAHAVDVALDMTGNDFNSRIAEGLAAMDRALLSAETAAASHD